MKCRDCKCLSAPWERPDQYPAVTCTRGIWNKGHRVQWYAYGQTQRNRGPVRKLGENCRVGRPRRPMALNKLTEEVKAKYRLRAQAAAIIRAWETNIAKWDPQEIRKSNPNAGLPSLGDVLAFLKLGRLPSALDVRELGEIGDLYVE